MDGVIVIDIGKTHSRVSLLDEHGQGLWHTARESPAHAGAPYRAFDTQALWSWICEALAGIGRMAQPSAIIPVTHGAAAAFVDSAGTLLSPVLDYEHEIEAPDYDAARPGFDETGSPPLTGGLNLGRQLWWLEAHFPALRRARMLLYPQYWAMRLCGAWVSEVTSLGCHTDLWDPRAGDWSSLAKARGWDRRFSPVVPAGPVGTLRDDIAAETGLSQDCVVHAGLHDSNAALIPFLQMSDCWVLSTGTWFIAMAPGAGAGGLSAERDTLLNVDYLGRPVPSARFMGGREFGLAGGGETDWPAVVRAAQSGLSILPNLTRSGGPIAGRVGRVPACDDVTRPGLALLYIAEMSAAVIALLGTPERLIVEGPAASPLFCEALAALLPRTRIGYITGQGGPTRGAAAAMLDLPPPACSWVESPPEGAALREHFRNWRAEIEGETE